MHLLVLLLVLLCLTLDSAETLSKAGESVILIRPFVKPDDVHGIIASKGVLTSEGGATSHAAVTCRQFGIPAIVGASNLKIDLEMEAFHSPSGDIVKKGDLLTIDGTSGNIYLGKIPLKYPKFDEDPYLKRYAELIWSENSEDYTDHKIGLLWFVRDIISNNGAVPRGFTAPKAYKPIKELLDSHEQSYIGFTQPPKAVIENALQEFHWTSDQDSRYVALGVLL